MAAVIIAQKYKTVYPVCEQKGLLYFDWNALNEDALNFEQSPQQLNKKILKDVRRQKTSIVLMHDLHETTNTVKALDPLIKTLKKKGIRSFRSLKILSRSIMYPLTNNGLSRRICSVKDLFT